MAGALLDQDVRRMSDLLSLASDGHDVDVGLPHPVLAGLAALVRCDLASFTDFDVGCATQYLDQEFDGDQVRTLGEQHDAEDPFWVHFWESEFCSYPTRTGDDRTVTFLSDFCSRREWHASPLYVDGFGADGIEHELMCCLASAGTRQGRVLLMRTDGPDFDERDRMVMALLRPHLAEVLGRTATRTAPALTPRQAELLRLVAAGRSTAQIAQALYLSPGTVRKHLENIFERLGVTSRTAAVARAFAEL